MDVFVARERTDLLVEPDLNAQINGTIPKGKAGRKLGESADGKWLQLKYPPSGQLKAQGWAEAGQFDAGTAEVELKPLVIKDFVRRAFSAATEFDAVPEHRQYPAITDFMLALSTIVSDMKNIQVGARVGPFQYDDKAWAMLTAVDGPPADFLPKVSPIDDWFWQIGAAALEMHLNGKEIAALHLATGASTAANPFIPDYLSLLHAHLLGAKAAFALWQARQVAAPGGDLAALVGAAPEVFAERPKLYFGGGDPAGALLNVADFNTQSAALLNAAFKTARALLLKHVPEIAPAGNATWMPEAVRLEGEKLDEGDPADNETIKGFFAATDFGPVGAGKAPAWCGAFAAHCMKSMGGPAADSVPKGAATAANWRNWGDRSLGVGADDAKIPEGAVVVLSPGEGTDTSGHVGFYIDRKDGMIELLGGNQGNTVKKSKYPLSRVVDIRWLGAASAPAEAVSAGALPAGANGDMATLIATRFAEAGFARHHQLAAIANAIDESNLDPKAHNPAGEDSWGLFQCNRNGGLGTGFSPEELMDPEINIRIILKAARGSAAFLAAADINVAVRAFVVDVERPADPEEAIKRRREIAKGLA